LIEVFDTLLEVCLVLRGLDQLRESTFGLLCILSWLFLLLLQRISWWRFSFRGRRLLGLYFLLHAFDLNPEPRQELLAIFQILLCLLRLF
jgi:hypothetical protein